MYQTQLGKMNLKKMKEKMSLFSRTKIIIAIPIYLLLLFVLYTNILATSKFRLFKSSQRYTKVEDEPLQSTLRRLVRGEDRSEFEETGFACHSNFHCDVCVANKPVNVFTEAKALRLYVPSGDDEFVSRTVRPYPRKYEAVTMKTITPVEISSQKSGDNACEVNHTVPALVFSTGAFTGNLFHEFNEVIIPLFITSRHFRSNLKLVITDYRPLVVRKYHRVLSRLTRHVIVNPATLNETVHCFPGAVVGLKLHGPLVLNASDIPGNHTMSDFRMFLRETYSLRATAAPGFFFWAKPKLILISRPHSRVFLNEDEMEEMMTGLGFDVIVAKPHMLSNLDKASGLVNRCSVMVGAHGAGLTNVVFLPDRAVVVQVVPLGMDWASDTYFVGPIAEMGLRYLEYKIDPAESSLLGKYDRDDPVISDPKSVEDQKGYLAAWAIYFNGQNLRIDLVRFRETMTRVMKLLERSTSLD